MGGAMSEYAIEIENLSVEYRTESGTVHALNGLDLAIGKGRTLGLVGETGAGKTTAGLAIQRLVPDPPGVITGGTILLDGEDVMAKSEREMERIRGAKVSMIFQDPMTSLNPVMRVQDQIAESVMIHQNLSAKDAVRKADEMLELVGIPGSRGMEYPHQFSGGMKQRVVIAIALACNPLLLIADEPTTALDVTIQAQVLEMMKGLRAKYSTSMLMITHDLGIVAEICDSVSVIYAGKVVEHGSLEDVFERTSHPYTRGLFGSLPNMDDRTAKLKPIRGLMPDPTALPAGCAFCPRCADALPRCVETPGPKVYVGEGHYVRCHLFGAGTEGKK